MERGNTKQTYVAALKDALSALLTNSLSPSQEHFLIYSAHTLAASILRTKFSRTPFIKFHLGLSEDDLAYDCIAELFERDDKERLIHLTTYFSNFDSQTLSGQEVLIHFRRLISSAINQNLMKVYHDFDPSLGKIIRNIKLAIVAHKAFIEIDRFDETCIAPIDCSLCEHLPAIDQVTLLEKMAPHIRGDEFVPELLSVLSRILREQEEYSRVVPLVCVALTFRALFVVKQNGAPKQSDESSSFEMIELVQKNVEQIKATVLNRTKEYNDLSPKIIDAYFKTIYDLLLAKMDEPNSSADSLFQGLKQNLKTLSSKEYKRHHRTRLEYYYKLCRDAIAAEFLNSPDLLKKGK